MKKKFIFILVFAICCMLFVSCGEKRDFIRIGLINTDEGVSSYITGFSRNQLNSEATTTAKDQAKKDARAEGHVFDEKSFSSIVDWTIPSKNEDKKYVDSSNEVITLSDSEYTIRFSASYNEVKNYVLFADSIQDLIDSFNRKKQGIDCAFISVSMLQEENIKLDSSKLKIIFVDTYASGEISGFWVMRKDYMEANSDKASKFVASLVKANEYWTKYASISYADAVTAVTNHVNTTKQEQMSDFEKGLYAFVNFMSCSGSEQSIQAELSDFKDQMDPNYYLAVFAQCQSDYQIKGVEYSFNRINNSTIVSDYSDFNSQSGTGYTLCMNLYNNVLCQDQSVPFNDFFDLHMMFNEATLYSSYCTLK